MLVRIGSESACDHYKAAIAELRSDLGISDWAVSNGGRWSSLPTDLWHQVHDVMRKHGLRLVDVWRFFVVVDHTTDGGTPCPRA